MKRVIVFGLSANPPTGLGGHAGLVRWAASEARLDEWDGRGPDEVWVLPVYRHAFSAKREMAPFAHRMAMARLAFEQLPGVDRPVRVLDIERTVAHAFADADPASVPGTVDVIRRLRADHPGAAFALLLGADTYRDLLEGRWKDSEALLKMVVIVAVPRKGVSADVPVRPGAPALDDVSSSRVRADPRRWGHALQAAVRDYIELNGLYVAERDDSSV